MKSALYDADERSMHLGKGAEVMLSEVRSSKLWNRQNTWHIMALIPFFLYGYFTCLNCNVFLTATSTLKKKGNEFFSSLGRFQEFTGDLRLDNHRII